MGQANYYSGLFAAGDQGVARRIFDALMSDDPQELSEALELVVDDGTWPDTFRYGLEALQSFRAFYRSRPNNYTVAQRAEIEAYDEDWTMDLIDQLQKHQLGVFQEKEPPADSGALLN